MMRTNSAKARPSGQAKAGGTAAESLGTQIAAAVGYTVVVASVAAVLFGSFSDDVGLGQIEVGFLPVAVLCLAAIRRKNAS